MVRKSIYLILLIIYSQHFFAQNRNDSSYVTIDAIESMPYFKGDINSFIKEKLQYPITALKDRIEGNVFISFWVEKDGKTSNHRVVKGVRSDLDNEALRILKLLVFAKSGMQNGNPVRVKYTLKVEFKLPYSP
jgi:TonB family protein